MDITTKFPMDADTLSIIQFLDGSKHFVIPVFQRNYAWTPRNCEQLYNDLIKIKDKPDKIHFFGSVVSVSNAGSRRAKYQIIDGQQRITTTTLLILAMYKLLQQGFVTSNDSELENDLHSYLFDVSGKRKLLPNKKDQKAFEKLFDEPAEYDQSSNLTTNFNFFYDHIQKAEITIDDLINAISRLIIVSIILPNGGNPQLVFESLNSTGLDLTESDKVRNYLFIDMFPEQQEKYYNQYWEQIETNTEGNLDEFIRDYLSVKQSKVPKKDKVYFEFKKYAKEENLQAIDLLSKLRTYSRFYKILLGNEKMDDRRINACIYRLNRLETTVTRPFFLEVLRIQSEGKITEDEMFQIFQLTENYLFRRLICDLPTNTRNKTFLKLYKEIERFDNEVFENYLEKFKFALLSKQDRYRFPDDEEFIEAFSTRPIYREISSKNREYIFERLENDGTKEDKDVYRHLNSDDKNDRYTIEHIMPQNPSRAWQEELGKDYNEIRRNWLHRIANLTLTAYNPNLSNRSFKEKCNSKVGGYKNSGIRMNQQIAQNTHWGKDELEKRNEELIKKALKIWGRPQTEYKPPQNELAEKCCTLGDDVILTGKKIKSFIYKGVEYSANGWQDMYQIVLRQLHSENKAILYKLAQKKKGGEGDFSSYFSTTKFKLYFDIDTKLYGQKTTDTMTKLRILRHLFELFEVDLEELEFHMKNKDKENSLLS